MSEIERRTCTDATPDETRRKEPDGGGRCWTRTRLDDEASGRVWWLGVGEMDAITAVPYHIVYATLPDCICYLTILYMLPYHIVYATLPYCICYLTILYMLPYQIVYATLPYCICYLTILYMLPYHIVYATLPDCICYLTILYMLPYHIVYATLPYCICIYMYRIVCLNNNLSLILTHNFDVTTYDCILHSGSNVIKLL